MNNKISTVCGRKLMGNRHVPGTGLTLHELDRLGDEPCGLSFNPHLHVLVIRFEQAGA